MKKEFIFDDQVFNWGKLIVKIANQARKLNKEFFVFNENIYIIIEVENNEFFFSKTSLTKKDIIE